MEPPPFRGPPTSMTMRSLLALTILALTPIAPAAVVLTNFPGPPTITNLIKGTGGVIPNPTEYGFEFTVSGGDYDLVTISLDITTHFGNVPLTAELYGSPSGPDTATFLTALSGPPQPINQIAVYAPTNALIISEWGSNLVRMQQILDSLDTEGTNDQIHLKAIKFATGLRTILRSDPDVILKRYRDRHAPRLARAPQLRRIQGAVAAQPRG